MTQAKRKTLPAPGRDGARMLLARVRVNRDPKAPDQWAPFDASHPVERARLRFEEKDRCWLGREAGDVDRRYRAARVWMERYLTAMGWTGAGAEVRERVDGGGDSEAAMNRRVQASLERIRILIGRADLDEPPARGMTARRRYDLDEVCGRGVSLSAHARALGLHVDTVRESLIAGLDAVAAWPAWRERLERAPVLMVRPAPKDKPRRRKKR